MGGFPVAGMLIDTRHESFLNELTDLGALVLLHRHAQASPEPTHSITLPD